MVSREQCVYATTLNDTITMRFIRLLILFLTSPWDTSNQQQLELFKKDQFPENRRPPVVRMAQLVVHSSSEELKLSRYRLYVSQCPLNVGCGMWMDRKWSRQGYLYKLYV